MKKLILTALISLTMATAIFPVSCLELLFMPVYTDKLVEGSYKVIESTDDYWIVIINGITYVYKLK